MRYAVVDQSNTVVNVVELTLPTTWPTPNGCTLVQSDQANVGDKFSNGQLVPTVTPTPIANPVQLGYAAILAGVTITSTSTPSLNATYSCDTVAISNINSVTTYIMLNNTFPNGAATLSWADIRGGLHVFPNTTVFKAFSTAIANYVSNVIMYQIGAASSLPPSLVGIP